MPDFKSLGLRLASVFAASAIPNILAGALVDVAVWKSSVMAGAIAVLAVVQKLAVGLRDGNLSSAEITDAFGE